MGKVADAAIEVKDVYKQPINMDEMVPVGAVDLTPADDGDDE